MIDAGVSITTEKDSYSAGKKVAKEALENMSVKPKLAILVIDALSRTRHNYAEVLKSVREELGEDVTLIGSTVNGVTVNSRYALKSVAIMLLGGDISLDSTFNYPKSRLNYESIAEDVYQNIRNAEPNDQRFMLLFQDGIKFPPEVVAKQKALNGRAAVLFAGLIARIFKKQFEEFKEKGLGYSSTQEFLEALYAKGWDKTVIGNLATNTRNWDSVEFFNDEIGADNIIGAILSPLGSSKFGFGYGAGAEPTGKRCKPTKNIGNFILKIDGKHALQGFCEAAGIQKEALREIKPYDYINSHTILGTKEKVGDKDIIHLVATITNPELENFLMTGFLFDRVPEEFEIFRSNMEVMHKTAELTVKQALENIDNPRFFLGFDCALRSFSYGDNLPRIIDTIDNAIGKDIPRMIIGSGGEIFGTKDIDYYWNNLTFLSLVGGD